MKTTLTVATVVWVILLSRQAPAEETQGKLRYPVLQVVKLSKPPAIDGKIEKGEWQEAAAITGFVSWTTRSVVPQFQDVVWYLGYDDKALYLAMHSPHPEGTIPFSRIKDRDNGNVTFEDHVEIQVSPHMDRDVIMRSGFYKLQVNARGALCDHHFYHEPGQDGIEWNSGTVAKCSIEKNYWDLELAMPINSMRKVESLDGESRVIHLVRADACNGVYYICWAVGDWLDWEKFAEVTFVPEGPVCRFLEAGALIDGNVDTQLEFVSRTPRQVVVTAQMDSPKETLYTKTEAVNVEPGKVTSVQFKQDGLEITDTGNTFRIRALDRQGGKDTVLYAVDIPVAKLTAEFRRKYIEPWLAGRRPTGAYDFGFGYRPYHNSMSAGIDLDFMGVPESFQNAPNFRLTVADKATGRPLKQTTVPIRNLGGSTQFPVPELPEGEYTVKMELLDKEGNVLDTKSGDFERIRFPWEHNTIGLSDTIVPPYTPLQVNGNRISPWGRTYTVAKTGLPEQLEVTGVPILRAPIRLESHHAGTNHVINGGTSRFVKTARGRVDIEGTGVLGSIATKVSAFLEYDGWYQVSLTLEPLKEVEVESLDLLVDPWERANTMAMNLSVTKGAIPPGMGVVWDNTQMPPGNDFVPVIYVGTPDRGIWWYQEWDRGWVRDPAKPSVQFERDARGLVTFRIRLFNTKHLLKEKRTIEFAFLAHPPKPLPDGWRKVAWSLPGQDYYTHWGVGFRHWGYSEDGFDLHTEEDFAAHGEFLLYPDDHHITWADWGGCFAYPLRRNPPGTIPCALYGSHNLMGLSMPEFRVFGGEWRGTMALPTIADGSIKDSFNYTRTSKRLDPEQTHCTGCSFTQSMIDCYVWYHKKLFEKSPAQGHDWDNNRINGVPHFNEEGIVDGWKFNLFGARQLHKRLNTMTWELGKKPFFVREHPFFPWAHAAWFTEGPFYIYQKGSDYIDTFPADQFRSQTCVYGGLIPNIRAGGDGLVRRSYRTLLGLCLTHDIGVGTGPADAADDRNRLLELLAKEVDFFDEKACQFLSYWDSGHLFRPNVDNVQVSAYRHRNKVLFVFLNSNDRPGGVNVNLGVSPVLSAMLETDARPVASTGPGEREERPKADGIQRGPRLRLYDPWDQKQTVEVPRKDAFTWGPIRIERHDFRLLVLE